MRLIRLFIITLFVSLPARADMIDANLYNVTEQYGRALAEYMKEANNGNSEAYYWIGTMHYYGKGTAQDYAKAIDWFLKAATEHGENGDPEAMALLGDIHYNGYGIDKNIQNALQYYSQAANLGHGQSGYVAGNLYAQGVEGIDVNLTYSLIYWEQAANNDHTQSMHNAAYLYEMGLAGSRDHDKAYALYLKAAEKDYAPSQTKVGIYAKNYEPKRNYEVAVKYLTAAAQKQQAIAQHELGIMYLTGVGVDKDMPKMIQLFEKAAANNYPRAARDLGDIFASDKYGYKDLPRSLEYYELGGKLGDADAQRKASLMHFNGQGTQRDVVKAAAWLIVAANTDPKTNESDRDGLLATLTPGQKTRANNMASSLIF